MKSLTIVGFLFNVICRGLVESRYVGGYFNSANNRIAKVEDLNPFLATHLYYSHVLVNDNGTFTIENEKLGFARHLADLKKINPDLKLLFSLSNVNDSFSTVVANKGLRKNFIQNALRLVITYDYDGLDFDWEFPKAEDKENFISLLSETYAVFKEFDLLLTAAVQYYPISSSLGYNVPAMSKYLDIINIMTYDYYGSWSNTTGQNSPLFASSLDSAYEKKYVNINASLTNWIDAGASRNKLAIGIPFYGKTFTLKDPKIHGLHAPSIGGGNPPSPTAYFILQNFKNYTAEWNDEQKSPYKYSGSTWLAYDDERSIDIKVKFAKNQDLSGVFVWHLAADDVYGEFCGIKQCLLQVVNDAIDSA